MKRKASQSVEDNIKSRSSSSRQRSKTDVQPAVLTCHVDLSPVSSGRLRKHSLSVNQPLEVKKQSLSHMKNAKFESDVSNKLMAIGPAGKRCAKHSSSSGDSDSGSESESAASRQKRTIKERTSRELRSLLDDNIQMSHQIVSRERKSRSNARHKPSLEDKVKINQVAVPKKSGTATSLTSKTNSKEENGKALDGTCTDAQARVQNNRSAKVCRSSNVGQDEVEDSDDGSERTSTGSNEDCVVISPLKQCKNAVQTLQPVVDRFVNGSQSKKDVAVPSRQTKEVHSVSLVGKIVDDPAGNKLSRAEDSTQQLGRTQAQLLVRKVYELETAVANLKKKLSEKEIEVSRLKKGPENDSDEISRLKNQLQWKDEQIDDLSKAVEKNMELEAKINRMLSSKEAYEEEVKALEAKSRLGSMDENETNSNNSETESNAEIGSKGKRKSKRKRSQGKDKESKKKDMCTEADDLEQLFVGSKPAPEVLKVLDVPVEKEKPVAVDPKPIVLPISFSSLAPTDDKQMVIVIDNKDKDAVQKGRHEIRRLVGQLTEETKLAGKMEAERRERVKKLRNKHLVVMETNPTTHQPVCRRLVLAMKEDSQEALVEVDKSLLSNLKPHQVEAVEFMWDTVVESIEQLKSKDEEGGGCILAHCMGLGKTLSVVTFVHTLLSSSEVGFKTCLVLAPLNAILNWVFEWGKWVKGKKKKIKIYELATSRQSEMRTETLSEWKKTGGVLVMGYQLFRILVSYNGRSKKIKQVYDSCLINPGADIIVCDEGHILKNDATALSKCVNKVHTKRRVVLTGTPLQNNLVEYHCMVSFVKPNLLGTRREFCNRFVNPITNGQHSDSTSRDVKLMKRRAHVLHEMLSGCVQRRDYTALVKFLPPKQEYVVSIRLSPIQIDLYQQYLERFTSISQTGTSGRSLTDGTAGSEKFQCIGLFADYQNLMRIWTHPWVLKLDEIRQDKKPLNVSDDDELESVLYMTSSESEDADEESEISIKKKSQFQKRGETRDTDIEVASKRKRKTEDAESVSSSSSTEASQSHDSSSQISAKNSLKNTAKVIAGEVIRSWQTKTRGKDGVADAEIEWSSGRREEKWWSKMVKDEFKTSLELSGKLVLLFEILSMSEQIGDKVLVFSQSLLSLDLIEEFLVYKTEQANQHNGALSKEDTKQSTWVKDEDYLRMDGSTGAQNRKKFTTNFNDASNERLRLFLISTRAGGLGINLDTANRVIIFDASWNPSHDVQSIFRVYRFGQQKPVFVYRFLAQGTMEEKIYERQVTKETLSQRVIDEHQIDRHFSSADLRELYVFKPDKLDDPEVSKRPLPVVPKDMILAELLSNKNFNRWIFHHHEHDSLLENRPEENLSEEERRAAWDDYEREKSGIYTMPMMPAPFMNWNHQLSMSSYRLNPPQYVRPSFPPVRPFISQSQGLPRAPYSILRVPPPAPGFRTANTSVIGTRLPAKPVYVSLAQLGVQSSLSQADLDAAVDYAFNQIPVYLRDQFVFQFQQIPKVMLEIFRYNPEITAENLKKRLAAFLGMHTRALENANASNIARTQKVSK